MSRRRPPRRLPTAIVALAVLGAAGALAPRSGAQQPQGTLLLQAAAGSGPQAQQATDTLVAAALRQVQAAVPDRQRRRITASPFFQKAIRLGARAYTARARGRAAVVEGAPPVEAHATADDAAADAIQHARDILAGARPPKNLLQRASRHNRAVGAREFQGPRVGARAGNQLPDAFDWRDGGYVKAVDNQEQCGCCWAFATSAAFEAAYAIQNKYRINVSKQAVLDCASPRYSCGGGWWAFGMILDPQDTQGLPNPDSVQLGLGVPLDSDDGYQGQQGQCQGQQGRVFYATRWGYVTSQTEVPDPGAIKQALYTHGPLASGIIYSAALLNYQKGDPPFNERKTFTVDSLGQQVPIDHAITIIGWDDNMGSEGAWIIKNSWGDQWGDNGFMYIEYGSNNVGYGAAWVDAAADDYAGGQGGSGQGGNRRRRRGNNQDSSDGSFFGNVGAGAGARSDPGTRLRRPAPQPEMEILNPLASDGRPVSPPDEQPAPPVSRQSAPVRPRPPVASSPAATADSTPPATAAGSDNATKKAESSDATGKIESDTATKKADPGIK